MNRYRVTTASTGLKRLATLPPEDRQACIEAYKFLQRMQAGEPTETADETRAVADHYKVLNNLLSVFVGSSHLLDVGCGRGRFAHHFATMTGGQVSGYNIDPNQLENAVEWAAHCQMRDRLHFKYGDHQSMYPADVCAALERAGFHIVLSAQERRGVAAVRAEARPDPVGAPAGPRTREGARGPRLDRGVPRPAAARRTGVDRGRTRQDRRPELADRRREAVRPTHPCHGRKPCSHDEQRHRRPRPDRRASEPARATSRQPRRAPGCPRRSPRLGPPEKSASRMDEPRRCGHVEGENTYDLQERP